MTDGGSATATVPRIRGQIFTARVDFLRQAHGNEALQALLAELPAEDRELLRGVDRDTWYPLAALMRLDRAICARLYAGDPGAYETLGAASARHRTEWLGEHATLVNPHGFFSRVAEEHRRFHDFGRAEYRRTGFTEGELAFTGYSAPDEVFCRSSVGYFRGVIEYLTRVPGIVEEVDCQCHGRPACRFRMRWMGSGKWGRAGGGR